MIQNISKIENLNFSQQSKQKDKNTKKDKKKKKTKNLFEKYLTKAQIDIRM